MFQYKGDITKNTNYIPEHCANSPIPKTEFSKKLLIALLVISFLFTAMSYILAFLDKSTVENLSIEVLRILWSCDGIGVLAYTMQNGIRAWSGNKYGINTGEQTSVQNTEKVTEEEIIETEVND